MCLAFGTRESTKDVDASFKPVLAVLDAAVKVAKKEGVPESWLNDGVKAYLSARDRGSYNRFLEKSNLRVFTAKPEYMLAMKCQALRLGEGYRDEEDIRYLLRNLGLRRYEDATAILEQYFPLESYKPTALAAVRELLSGAS